MVSFPLSFYVVSMIFLYMPFHFFEEAVGNFPESMYQHKWIPERITYGHWMANNIFLYFPTLLIGYLIWFLFPNLIFLGLGILIWGIINTFDHIFYSINDKKISPGLFTGILYLLLAIGGFITTSHELNLQTVISSIGVGIFYFAIPVFLCMKLHNIFKSIFK